MDVEQRGVSAVSGGTYLAAGSIRAGDCVSADGKTVRRVGQGPSALFSINDALVPPLDCWGPGQRVSYRARPGEEIVARLASVVGVMSVQWFDGDGYELYRATGGVCRFRAGGPGSSGALRCIVNGGIDRMGRHDESLIATVSWSVEGAEVSAEASPEKPKPAPGQVWRFKPYHTSVVRSANDDGVTWTTGAITWHRELEHEHWECIGIKLADGRQMLVGETWELMGMPCTVMATEPNGSLGGAFRLQWHGQGVALRLFDHIRDQSERWHKVEKSTHACLRCQRKVIAEGLEPGFYPICPMCHMHMFPIEDIVAPPALPTPEGLRHLRALGHALESLRPATSDEGDCGDRHQGRICTRPKGHEHDHVAHRFGLPDAHWPRDLAREAEREIERLLVADARAHPAFARARRAAALADLESRKAAGLSAPTGLAWLRVLLAWLHEHEAGRPRGYVVREHADPALKAYERARGLG